MKEGPPGLSYGVGNAQAERIIRRVCAVGPTGDIDELLVTWEASADRDGLFNRFGRGNTGLHFEDKQMIDACFDRLAAWVRDNPNIPDPLPQFALPRAE